MNTLQHIQLTDIQNPHDNDVLSGRGNYINGHPGNKRFREYVLKQRALYVTTPKCDKPAFAKMIVTTIRNLVPPGRFLKQDPKTQLWSDIGDKKAWNKTRQALREKAPETLQALKETSLSSAETTEPQIHSPGSGFPMMKLEPRVVSANLLSILDNQLYNAAMASATHGVNRTVSSIPINQTGDNLLQSTTVSNLPTTSAGFPEVKVPNDNEDTRMDESLIGFETSPLAPRNAHRSSIKWVEKIPISHGDVKKINHLSNEAENVKKNIRVDKRSAEDKETFSGRRSSLRKPKYSEMSVTGVTDPTSFCVKTGDTFGMNHGVDTNINYLGSSSRSISCEDFSIPEPIKKAHDNDTNMCNNSANSLYIDGQLAEEVTMNSIDTNKIFMEEEQKMPSDISNELILDILQGQEKINVINDASMSDKSELTWRSSISTSDKRSMSDKSESTLRSSNSTSDKPESILRLSLLSMADRTPSETPSTSPRRVSISMPSSMRLTGTSTSAYFKRLSSTSTSDKSRPYSFSTLEISEVNEDDLSYAESKGNTRSLGTNASRMTSLDDLSYFSGRMSICENMSLCDSGIFAMDEAQLEDWRKEAMKWEEEAIMAENEQT